MATFTFNKTLKTISLDAPQTEMTIQDLLNNIREYEDELNNMDYKKIADASGKEPLGGGIFVGITLKLLDGWRVTAEPRLGPDFVRVNITGGNLVTTAGLGADPNDPIAPSAYVTFSLTSSSSATLQDAQSIENLKYAVENIDAGKATGVTFFWDPNSGDDLFDGLSEEAPLKTFAMVHSKMVSGRNDVVNIITPTFAGVYTITEPITITKNNIHVRGSGRDIVFQPTITTDTITIDNADDVEISNIEIRTHSVGTNNAINLHGKRTSLNNIFITEFTGKGIDIHDCINCKMSNIKIQGGTGVGANDGGFYGHNTKDFILTDTEIVDCAGFGMKLVADTPQATSKSLLRNVTIHHNNGYQMDIGTNVYDIVIDSDCFIGNFGLGRILDNGELTHDLELNNKLNTMVIKSGRSLDR